MIELYNQDCIEVLKDIPDKSIDLIITDPPYQINSTQTGNKSEFNISFQKMNDQIEKYNLCKSYNPAILDELIRVMKKINIYIWCNGKQIQMYIDKFVKEHKCKFDIIIWQKKNAPPTYNNKYLTDKEFCLYFRRGGYCQPIGYEEARTVYTQPLNTKDKKLFKHPTIKPLNIIENLVLNSSKENDIILDPFMGSGTTGVACKKHNRKFIGIEINKEFYDIAVDRINNT